MHQCIGILIVTGVSEKLIIVIGKGKKCYLCSLVCAYTNLRSVATQTPRGGHSHRRRSHCCDRGQEAVKGSRAVFGVGQVVKDNFQTW